MKIIIKKVFLEKSNSVTEADDNARWWIVFQCVIYASQKKKKKKYVGSKCFLKTLYNQDCAHGYVK